ncbi:MAG: prepilin-type N-terminal cleavage/methylation domain-containing protein [Sphingopyxis sp.]|nr:prepilin-type N-terminal cleavage/methylation domain-containing protein [Sphingopyxis sp.]
MTPVFKSYTSITSAPQSIQAGFTLVEISIVMIIIGLLVGGTSSAAPCSQIRAIDRKIDDDLPHMGELTAGWDCDPTTCTGPYQIQSNIGVAMYDFKEF